MTEITFASRFADLRIKRGWTDLMAAAMFNVDLRTWKDWEDGTRVPNGAAIRLLEVYETGSLAKKEAEEKAK